MSHPQRSPFLLDRAQARLFARNLLYCAPPVLVLAGAFVGALTPAPDAEERSLSLLEALLFFLRDSLWLLLALTVLVFVLHSFWLAHRVLGPLVRFRRAFREIDAGHLAQRIVLRPKDYHVEEALAFNSMMDALSTRLHQVKRRYDQAQLELKAAEEALAAGGNALEHLRAVRAELVRCDEEWAWFDLAPCTITLSEAEDGQPRPHPTAPKPRPALPARPRAR